MNYFTVFILLSIVYTLTGFRLKKPQPYRGPHISGPTPPPPETRWITQPVNHFGYEDKKTYKQRYLVSEKYFDASKNPGSIMFYTGNEGDITDFYQNSGALFEMAEEFGSVVVFAESRYYGNSMIFKDDGKTVDYSFFSAEQILADYMELIKILKEKYGAKKVIAFGGSLGGMYAAYFRIKYPHVVDGAFAASAPVLQFQGMVDPYGFSKIVTEDFYKFNCGKQIRDGFDLFMKTIDQGKFEDLGKKFKTCQDIKSKGLAMELMEYISSALIYMAMTNYPGPSSFLMPLPSFPVQATCDRIVKGHTQELDALLDVTQLFFNYTGDKSCFDITSFSESNDLGFDSWDYQACTEFTLPSGNNGKTDFFPPAPWSFQNFSDQCFHDKGVRPRPTWIPDYYGVQEYQYSNIIFSNGEYDPWRAGGVTHHDPSKEIYAIYVKDGAHHTTLRFSNPQYDTPSITAARKQEREIIKKWIFG